MNFIFFQRIKCSLKAEYSYSLLQKNHRDFFNFFFLRFFSRFFAQIISSHCGRSPTLFSKPQTCWFALLVAIFFNIDAGWISNSVQHCQFLICFQFSQCLRRRKIDNESKDWKAIFLLLNAYILFIIFIKLAYTLAN